MEIHATARFIRMTPRKVRLVADVIRGLFVNDARDQLKFSTKAAALPLLKVLSSAVANAEHHAKADVSHLRIGKIVVEEGPRLKRYRPRAFGRAAMIQKRMSHIRLTLTDQVLTKSKKNRKVMSAKPEEKLAVKSGKIRQTRKKTVRKKDQQKIS